MGGVVWLDRANYPISFWGSEGKDAVKARTRFAMPEIRLSEQANALGSRDSGMDLGFYEKNNFPVC